jgi:hypothetical protein
MSFKIPLIGYYFLPIFPYVCISLLNKTQNSNFIMKKIKQILTIAIVAIAISTSANAQMKQGDISYQAGLEAALPTGDLALGSSFGIGGFGQLNYAMSDQFHIIGSLGYNSFFAKSGGSGSLGAFLLKVGGAYYVNEQFNLQGGLGYGSFSSSGGSGSLGGLHFAFGAGYDLEALKLSVNYNTVSVTGGSFSWIGLKVGYAFGN